MAGKLVTEGKVDILTYYFKNDQTSRPVDSLYVGLYTNTTEPTVGAIIGTGLTELALSGYARIPLIDSDWTVAGDTATNVLKTFTASELWGNIYGQFLTDEISGVSTLIAVKHFTNGPFYVADTKTIDITPTFLIV